MCSPHDGVPNLSSFRSAWRYIISLINLLSTIFMHANEGDYIELQLRKKNLRFHILINYQLTVWGSKNSQTHADFYFRSHFNDLAIVDLQRIVDI